jgi:hypothetical protein
MSYPTLITVCILALMAIVATLAGFLGWVLGKRRADDAAERAARKAFDEGADVDAKGRRIADRARRFGR